MPVAERPVHVRDKNMFREKRKISRMVVLLTGGVVLTLISDATFVMFSCLQDCPVRQCSVASDLDEKGISALVHAYQQMEKYCVEMEPPLETYEDIGYYEAEPTEEIEISMGDGSNFTAQNTLFDLWDDREDEADPTRKKSIQVYEDVGKLINHILHDYVFYKDENAADIQSSDYFVYNHNPVFDAILLVSLF